MSLETAPLAFRGCISGVVGKPDQTNSSMIAGLTWSLDSHHRVALFGETTISY